VLHTDLLRLGSPTFTRRRVHQDDHDVIQLEIHQHESHFDLVLHTNRPRFYSRPDGIPVHEDGDGDVAEARVTAVPPVVQHNPPAGARERVSDWVPYKKKRGPV
jgi:hypothetical protein